MYADQHVHTSFSGDSDTSPEDQLEKAIALGMDRICFTDHHDHGVVSEIDFELDIPRYLEKMSCLSESYAGRIRVLCGIELGLQEHISGYLQKLTEDYPFDLIIGSVHFVDGLDPYYPEYFEKWGNDAYSLYFDTVLRCIGQIKCYDSLGHLDYIARYGGKHGLSYSYAGYADLIDPILRRVIDDGKALECNTGGLSRGLCEPNPCYDILKRYRQMGGELITIGSDAHSPDTLGCSFESTGQCLKEIGFKYYTVYSNRKASFLPL